MVRIGVEALPMVALTAFSIGLTLAMQGAHELQRMGAVLYVPNLVSVSLLRELGPLLAAILVAGRSGSSITAQIGVMRVTEEALYRGIEQLTDGERLGKLSSVIQQTAEGAGFSVVRSFVGHGIGKRLHEEPPVPNYGQPESGLRLRQGMVLAIEPMVNLGGYEVKIKDDGWTAVTSDGSLSAHFEHSVAITENGPYILSKL